VRRPVLAVERAARNDLKQFPDTYRNCAVAKGYLLLARRLDAGISARDSAALLREMRQVLLTLHELSPAESPDSTVDQLADRREKRMKGFLSPDEARSSEGTDGLD
jgi:hypothetical protein